MLSDICYLKNMQVIRELDKNVIDALQSGQVLVYPTETCYGLGGDATNSDVVEKIYKIKQRLEEKPFLVVVPDVAMAMEYLEWGPQLDEIASRYWPGPLTVVGGVRLSEFGVRNLANGVVAPDGTIAVRVTAHPVAAELARALGRPLISTSANISGREPSYSADDIIKMFEGRENQPDILIDCGVLFQNPPTTIVSIVGGEIEVLRKGSVEVDVWGE